MAGVTRPPEARGLLVESDASGHTAEQAADRSEKTAYQAADLIDRTRDGAELLAGVDAEAHAEADIEATTDLIQFRSVELTDGVEVLRHKSSPRMQAIGKNYFKPPEKRSKQRFLNQGSMADAELQPAEIVQGNTVRSAFKIQRKRG
ncbi:hypothetical protein MOX02_14040 [Methylobacterium oxalidis]|uniref:Uncharacterized protein n=1 Tax=Methylobacterium oxalidis TaxID=944322 RepID=A0A512J077_9HYPH|nr:hypothetical protein MOX02_14040 [Methylobacterium oxalidis]GLS64126.1 hypothetical protein GCM10007888_25070 [Methylobacterium oxalidis]